MPPIGGSYHLREREAGVGRYESWIVEVGGQDARGRDPQSPGPTEATPSGGMPHPVNGTDSVDTGH